MDKIGQLDRWVGECFRDAALQLIDKSDYNAASITAIGSHGQTLRHQPRAARPFSLQIGDANVIAAGTGITTVADFRRMDVASGGEGAPLAPAFHRWLFADENRNRAVLNIGGMANVSMLRTNSNEVIGFDTGPGNTLLDGWIRSNLDQTFDHGGEWARSGNVHEPLLGQMLADPYFDQPPPKSTGFEYFNGAWLRSRLASIGEVRIPGSRHPVHACRTERPHDRDVNSQIRSRHRRGSGVRWRRPQYRHDAASPQLSLRRAGYPQPSSMVCIPTGSRPRRLPGSPNVGLKARPAIFLR